jgi:hypothetical protein
MSQFADSALVVLAALAALAKAGRLSLFRTVTASRGVRCSCGAILVIAMCALPLAAQQSTGTISGTVTDPQGAVVGRARVTVVQVDTAAALHVSTNDSGNYTAPGLAVGRYQVQVEADGFKKVVRDGVVLQVNQNARVDIAMELGQVAESVNVTAQAVLVDTGSATLGQVVENRRLQELPLNGRSGLAFTFLTSGVISNSGPTQSGFGDRGVALSSVSINGGPNALNSSMLDGNNNTLSYVGEVSIPPAVDAVEEFKVQSGPMSAEYGFTAGGAINLVTKSGTNQFHGTLYEFVRNDKFDARNAYSLTKLPLRYNQYGGAVGGPVIKNKVFGFLNYEEYVLRKSTPRISSVPIDAWRNGDFSNLRTSTGVLIPIYDPSTTAANPNGSGQVRQLFPGNIVPQSRFDRTTPKVVTFFPEPNRAPINTFTQSQNYQDAAVTNTDWAQWNWRLDYRLNDQHSLFLRYTQAHHHVFNNSIFTEQTVGNARTDDQVNRNAVVSHNWTISPNTLNNLRFGLNRQAFAFAAQSAGDWSQKLGLPYQMVGLAFPNIDFGFGAIGGGAIGFRSSLNWDAEDMLTRITGNHTVKLGVNFRAQQANNQQGSTKAGSYDFSGLTTNPQSPAGTGSNMAQMLLGEVGSASIGRISGSSWVGNSWSAFVQDDWRVLRRLTLNLGLRWDWQQKPYERNNGQINFDLTQKDPVSGLPGVIVFAGRNGQPRNFRNEDYKDFGPRLGWSWDMFGSGKTVFRGGYGIFYPSVFYRQYFGNANFFTQTITTYAAQGPGQRAFRFQDGFPYSPAGVSGVNTTVNALLGQSVLITEPDGQTPMSEQWTASLQQDVKGWLFEATYAGNKGNHFPAGNYTLDSLPVDQRITLGLSLNDSVPNPLAGKVPGGLGAATVTRERSLLPYPAYNDVQVYNPVNGNYTSHQLQLNVRKQFKSGFFASLAYTAGKTISDSIVTPTFDFGFEGTAESGYQDGHYNRQVNKSIDPDSVSQRAAVTLLYELPFGAGKPWNPGNGAVRRLVSGWQVNSIGIMQTGLPLIVRGANNFGANRPNSTGVSARLDNPTAARWFNTDAFINPPNFTVGNVGRTLPDVRSPGTVNWDLSAMKTTQIRERINLQFRAELFNFMNHVNLNAPSTSFTAGPNGKNANANFGTISGARDPRSIQFGLKLLF